MDILEKKLPPRFLILAVNLDENLSDFIRYFTRILEWFRRFPTMGDCYFPELTRDSLEGMTRDDAYQLRKILIGPPDGPGTYRPSFTDVIVHPYSMDRLKSTEFKSFLRDPGGLVKTAAVLATYPLTERAMKMVDETLRPAIAYLDLFSYSRKQYKKLIKVYSDTEYSNYRDQTDDIKTYFSALVAEPEEFLIKPKSKSKATSKAKARKIERIKKANKLIAERYNLQAEVRVDYSEFVAALTKALELRHATVSIGCSVTVIGGMGAEVSVDPDLGPGDVIAHRFGATIRLGDFTVDFVDSQNEEQQYYDAAIEAIRAVPGYEGVRPISHAGSLLSEVCPVRDIQGDAENCMSWNVYISVLEAMNPNYDGRNILRILGEQRQTQRNLYLYYFLWHFYQKYPKLIAGSEIQEVIKV